MNAARCFGLRGEQHVTRACKRGATSEVTRGGTLDGDNRSLVRPTIGGRGNLVGSYDNTTSLIVSVYGTWSF